MPPRRPSVTAVRPLRIAGQWVATAWSTAGELSLEASLTSGQAFRWTPREVDLPLLRNAGSLPAPPLKSRRTESGPAAIVSHPPVHWAWVGVVGRHVLELTTVRGSIAGQLDCLHSQWADAGAPPKLTTLQTRLGGEQLLLLSRLWNRTPQPQVTSLLSSADDRSALKKVSASPADKFVETPDQLALLVMRYLRLDDDLLQAWSTEWLPNGWERRPLPSLQHQTAGKSGSATSAERIQRMLPRDNTALRQRLSANAVAVQALLAANTAADPSATAAMSKPPTGNAAVPYGVRLLRQDPFETLLSFLCSQNNHQKRITSMIESLCSNFGDQLEVETGNEAAPQGRTFCAFPTVLQLSTATDERLRALGFGYRAKFMVGTARTIVEKTAQSPVPSDNDLGFGRTVATRATLLEQREELLQLPGVGRKVADCILLFAYDQSGIVPIDTHMAQITDLARAASWDAIQPKAGSGKAVTGSGKKTTPKPPAKQSKGQKKSAEGKEENTVTLTPKVHDAFQQHYSHVFGQRAGWAHCFLFAPRLSTSAIALAT
jgi:8-oxoguanine DNA-glycosylase Ogg